MTSVLCCFLLAVMASNPGLAQIQTPGGNFPVELPPKKLGEYCSTTDQCRKIPNALCAKGVCACPAEFVRGTNNTICLRIVTLLDNPCEQTDQCRVGPDGSMCKNNKCVCLDDFHYVNQLVECVISKELDVACDRNEQCYLSQDKEQHVECFEQKCKCSENFVASPDKQNCNGAEMTSVFWVSTLMAFLLARTVA